MKRVNRSGEKFSTLRAWLVKRGAEEDEFFNNATTWRRNFPKKERWKRKASVENWKAFKVVHDEYFSKRIRFILRRFLVLRIFSFFSIFLDNVLSKFFFILGASKDCLDRRDLGSSLSRVVRGFISFRGPSNGARTKESDVGHRSRIDPAASIAR